MSTEIISSRSDTVVVKLNPDEIVVGDILAAAAISPRGILLAPKGTTISEKTRQLLLRNRACAMVQRTKEEMKAMTPNENVLQELLNENSISLSDATKEQAKASLEYMYEHADDGDEVVDVAKSTSSALLDCVLDARETHMSVEALRVSDEYTFKHSVDVAMMGCMLGKSMGLDEKYLQDIMTAGILHDFGKIDVPINILNKPGKLTDAEFDIIKKHPTFGYERLRDSKELSESVKRGILTHHEKFSGFGYPLGLSGEKIPMIGRILSIVDVYDALVTKRPYKNAKKPVEAYEMMLSMTGQFDINIFSIFTQTVILYPNGTLIELFPGVNTFVSKQNPGYPTRPVLVDMKTGTTYDLLHDKDLRSISIEHMNI